MTFKEESFFFYFFFNFILFPSPFLTTPSLLLLEMFHLLRGRQGEGSRNSLKTEKGFAKTGRLSGRKKPNSGCQHVFFLRSLPSALAFLLLFLRILFLSHVLLLLSSTGCPLSGWRWLLWVAGGRWWPPGVKHGDPGGTWLSPVAPQDSVVGIHAGQGSIPPSSQGCPAFQTLSRQGMASRPTEAEGGQDSS